jgi:hypothetical protein
MENNKRQVFADRMVKGNGDNEINNDEIDNNNNKINNNEINVNKNGNDDVIKNVVKGGGGAIYAELLEKLEKKEKRMVGGKIEEGEEEKEIKEEGRRKRTILTEGRSVVEVWNDFLIIIIIIAIIIITNRCMYIFIYVEKIKKKNIFNLFYQIRYSDFVGCESVGNGGAVFLSFNQIYQGKVILNEDGEKENEGQTKKKEEEKKKKIVRYWCLSVVCILL